MRSNPPLPTDAIRNQIGKLAASRVFEGSARLRKLLSYTVSQALAGNGDQLKESVLGVEVFGRAPGYDSAANSIVRVEFARLRKKLEEYYGSEGINDSVRIIYRRGSYNPEFVPKDEVAPTTFEGSVAVLPLVCGGSEDDECLADGITDELITALSRVRGLKVVARTSCFAFKGKSDDIREIGRALQVNSVLEGSLRRNHDVVRVHVQLIDVNNGCQLWGQKYERHLTDVFEVQEEIASAIVNALRIEFPRVWRGRQLRPTSDPAAYALVVFGPWYFARYFYPMLIPTVLALAIAMPLQAKALTRFDLNTGIGFAVDSSRNATFNPPYPLDGTICSNSPPIPGRMFENNWRCAASACR